MPKFRKLTKETDLDDGIYYVKIEHPNGGFSFDYIERFAGMWRADKVEEGRVIEYFDTSVDTDIEESETELKHLREWKRQELELLSALDLKAIGKELGVRLGETVADKILPAIKRMKDSQTENSDVLEWTAIFYGALNELVELKKLKDTSGKTSEYEERQPKAWYLAFEAIELWKKSDYGALPLPTTKQKGE